MKAAISNCRYLYFKDDIQTILRLLYPSARGTFFAAISSFSDIITLTKITLQLHLKVTC
jgi:hypothetical protein